MAIMWFEEASLVVAALGIPMALVSTFAAVKANRGGKATRSQEIFKEVRKTLWDQRPLLNSLSLRLHTTGPWESQPIPGTRLLALSGLNPPYPLPLDDVGASLLSSYPEECPHDISRALKRVLPRTQGGERFSSYSSAMGELTPPGLFFNAPIYRLIGLERKDPLHPTLHFSMSTYFKALDTAEAVCHELALLPRDRWTDPVAVLRRQLPLRAALTRHFDSLSDRVLSVAINTLTLIRRSDGGQEFILHKRDPSATATFAGHYMVSPIGIFQPSTQSPLAKVSDFSYWRTIMREFNEEILGHPEADSQSGETIDYSTESPYVELDAALATGSIDAKFLGIGVDPTELSLQMLTCLVIDADVFPSLGWSVADRNPEGILVGHCRTAGGELRFVPFRDKEVKYHLELGTLSAASEACLSLAWQWRNHLQLLS